MLQKPDTKSILQALIAAFNQAVITNPIIIQVQNEPKIPPEPVPVTKIPIITLEKSGGIEGQGNK